MHETCHGQASGKVMGERPKSCGNSRQNCEISALPSLKTHFRRRPPRKKLGTIPDVEGSMNIFGRKAHTAKLTPPPDSPILQRPAGPAFTTAAAPRETADTNGTIQLTDDAIIARFEPLTVHCPRNGQVFKTLAEAYTRKSMFDKALASYDRALEIAGGKNSAIEKAIAETTLKRFNWELSKLDPKTTEYAALNERIQKWRLEYQWRTMEKANDA